MAIHQFIRKIISPFLIPIVKWYLSKDRLYEKGEIQLLVKSGVFHPGFFGSTSVLRKFILQHSHVSGRKVLELGAGTGVISILLYRLGAIVTASDISRNAIENIKINAQRNDAALRVIHSDMFENIKDSFDLIVINPPYYRRKPVQEPDHAWYAGESLQYFYKLFAGLPGVMHSDSRVLMVLSDDCNLEEINKIAGSNSFKSTVKHREFKWIQNFYIIEFKQSGSAS